MLKDVLTEFHRLGSVHTFWRDAVPQAVELLGFVVKGSVGIHTVHLFSELPTSHLFLMLLHFVYRLSKVGFVIHGVEIIVVVMVAHEFVLGGASLG